MAFGKPPLVAEGIPSIDFDWSAKRRQKAVDKVTGKVMEAVKAGDKQYDVTGTWRDMWSKTQEPEVYEDVASRLDDQDVEIEVHRYVGRSFYRSGEDARLIEIPTSFDVVTVMAVGGTAVVREQHPGAEGASHHVERVYPPPDIDVAALHDQSLMGGESDR